MAGTVTVLERHGWSAGVEVSFAIYGERGSIDVLATHRLAGAALAVEVKSRLVSLEEMLRTIDRKVRLTPAIVEGREGWRPQTVGRLVVLEESSTNRRRVARSQTIHCQPAAGSAAIVTHESPGPRSSRA